ncbi:MAG: holdfast anchoring protein HfaA [Rhizomicrobium sp.]
MGVAEWLSEFNGQSFMPMFAKLTALVGASILVGAVAAQAGPTGDSSSYNTPFGMTSQAQQNQTVNASLRDSNGNLTMVDGQFQSSQFASGFGMPGPEVNGQGGVGGLTNSVNGVSAGGSSGAAYGGSTAIGNSLNVITAGSGNTVIVNSSQTNNGNQTASTNMNGN